MTTFCTILDVQNLLVSMGTFTDSTQPTKAQVEGYISDKDAEMRGIIVRLGIDPADIEDPYTLKTLALYCAYGVAAEIFRASRQVELEAAQAYQALYEKGLNAIRSGEVTSNETYSESHAIPRSRYTRNPTGYPEPKFQMGIRQW